MNPSTPTIPLKVPDLGGFDQVEVIEILVKPGDKVAPEDPLITLESDKAAMDIPAEQAGVIESIQLEAGQKVSQGDLIGQLKPEAASASAGEEDSAPQGAEADDEAARPEPEPESATASKESPTNRQPPKERRPQQPETSEDLSQVSFDGAHASPAVRRFARQLGADLNQIEGSARQGRITKEDVQAFVKRQLESGPSQGPPAQALDPQAYRSFGPVEVRDLSRIRKKSAQKLQANWTQVPLVTQFDEADVTETEAFRQTHKQAAQEQGVKLTLLPLVAKACVKALQEFPEVNAAVDAAQGRAILKQYYHLGFAVDTPQGLVVVVVRDADQKGVYQIAQELDQAAQRARDAKLKPQDTQGSSFSISNLGAAGGVGFTPLVNGDNVGVLGLSRAQTQPVWDGKAFEPRLILPVSFSYDHRLIDGVQAARFTRRLCVLIEELRTLLL